MEQKYLRKTGMARLWQLASTKKYLVAASCIFAIVGVVVIAHRLRTIMDADKIVVLDGGCLAEEGRSDSLIANDSLFARLYRIQQESLGWSVGRA